jgi:hypothetical protein
LRFDQRLRARINIGQSGNNTIIPNSGLIEIDHFNFVVTGAASTVTLKDGAATIADYTLAANSSFIFDNMNPSLNALALEGSFIISLSGSDASLKGFVLYRTNA